jgi:hypothetical protein
MGVEKEGIDEMICNNTDHNAHLWRDNLPTLAILEIDAVGMRVA